MLLCKVHYGKKFVYCPAPTKDIAKDVSINLFYTKYLINKNIPKESLKVTIVEEDKDFE